MKDFVSEEFKITNITMANYAEIHPFENSDFLHLKYFIHNTGNFSDLKAIACRNVVFYLKISQD